MQQSTYHSSEDSESVNVGVGRRFRFFELLSSMDAIASLSARRLILLLWDEEEAKAVGGGEADIFKCPFRISVLSTTRSFSSCSLRIEK